jgi:hypothetical protein
MFSDLGIRANHLQEIREPGSAEAADDVPAFHAHVPRVLTHPGQGLKLRQLVFSRLLHRAVYGQSPLFQINSRIGHVITVDGELLKRYDVGVRESGSQMSGTKQPRGNPIAEA